MGDLQTLLRHAAPVLVAGCAVVVLLAVLVNVVLAPPSSTIRSEHRSPVATGTMLGFFGILHVLLRLQLGVVRLPALAAHALLDIGLVLVLLGTGVQVMGRIALGRQWGDHVIVYQDHALVSTGMFRWVRHPLYASLVWMACGAALVFANAAALAATLGIFLPAMVYRARQEEAVLMSLFPAYADYRRRTGMLVPWPWPRR